MDSEDLDPGTLSSAVEDEYFLGIDVGSAEVRSGLVRKDGRLIDMATCPIRISSPRPGYFQQSSKEIWQAVAKTVKKVMQGMDWNQVKGIGCDATCSLVVVGADGQPVSVSPQGDDEDDVIMWMDHRAAEEAEIINQTQHELLSYLGGKVSLEMQMPKLLWLSRNLPESFSKAQHFFDLPDFLTWKLTGSLTRSHCSLVCKWMYEGSREAANPGWNSSFLRRIGLEELCQNNFSKIGRAISKPGGLVGYLNDEAAAELGLKPGMYVGASLIDAHAGTLGLLGIKLPEPYKARLTERICMICGTSSCFMLLSERGAVVDGVWGPYCDVVLEQSWLSEGGQSSAGQLVDHIVKSHPFKLDSYAPADVCRVLTDTLTRMAQARACPLQSLTKSFHVYPDFRGNRSPLADPDLRGMISGLDLESDEEQLAIMYLATLQALSYSARQTVDRLESSNLGPIKCVILCGGLSKNNLFVKTLAGVMNRPVVLSDNKETTILGSAMLGRAAANSHSSFPLRESMAYMRPTGQIVVEQDDSIIRFHEKKYKVYLKMQEDQIAYRNIMSQE